MHKKILVISSNCISKNTNNGKTILSFLTNIQNVEIHNLFFNNEMPNSDIVKSFFRITDRDILKKRMCLLKEPGKVININENINSKDIIVIQKHFIIKNPITQLIREVLWSKLWLSEKLNIWLNSVCPDLILFNAGDILFQYDIVQYVKSKFKSKLVVFITDDYFSNKSVIRPIEAYRKNKIFKKIFFISQITDLLITISDKMRQYYFNVLSKDSFVYSNTDKDYYTTDKSKFYILNNDFEIAYSGGLHTGRLYTIKQFAKKIYEFNSNIRVKIYSNTKVSKYQIKILKKYKNIYIMGSYSGVQLKNKLREANFLLLVESFKRKDINRTFLSMSTKVSEYVNLGLPVISYGPLENPSINFFKDISISFISKKGINNKILSTIFDNTYLNNLFIKFNNYRENNLNRNLINEKNIVNQIELLLYKE